MNFFLLLHSTACLLCCVLDIFLILRALGENYGNSLLFIIIFNQWSDSCLALCAARIIVSLGLQRKTPLPFQKLICFELKQHFAKQFVDCVSIKIKLTRWGKKLLIYPKLFWASCNLFSFFSFFLLLFFFSFLVFFFLLLSLFVSFKLNFWNL